LNAEIVLDPFRDGLVDRYIRDIFGGEVSDPRWVKLVRTAAGLADDVEGLAEVVGQGSAAVIVCWSAWVSTVR
jgi:hypothetical protein